jgi:hypothetical protein
MNTNAKTKEKSRASNEGRHEWQDDELNLYLDGVEDKKINEYHHAEFTFMMAMIKIKRLKEQGRSPARIGFEMGLAYPYYQTIIYSNYLTSKNNPNKKAVLALCQKFDKDLDNILPMRKLLK